MLLRLAQGCEVPVSDHLWDGGWTVGRTSLGPVGWGPTEWAGALPQPPPPPPGFPAGAGGRWRRVVAAAGEKMNLS